MDELDNLKKQHLNNYKSAIKEIITNNTLGLINDDLMSLFRVPPLDSMDLIKSKLVSLAKKGQLIINTEMLNRMVKSYRDFMCKKIVGLKSIRIDDFVDKIDNFEPARVTDVFKIMKKDLNIASKKMKNELKELVNYGIDNNIIKNIGSLFNENDGSYELVVKEFIKYLKKDYVKQLFESVDVKIIVKDTILINGIKEQGERYIFTNEHSRLFDFE